MIQNTPNIEKISPEKQKMLNEFQAEISGLSPSQIFPVLLKYRTKFQEQNIQFTKNETNFLLDQIEKKQLSPQEQLAMQAIRQMLPN